MYVFPKWSLSFCVTSEEDCANQELVGLILSGTHTWDWPPEAAQSAERWWRVLAKEHRPHHHTPSLQPTQDGWALGESGKGEVESEL